MFLVSIKIGGFLSLVSQNKIIKFESLFAYYGDYFED